jgi:hypothetical protein
LSALGGLPYCLKGEIEGDLDNWKKYGLTPLFVFDGLYIVGQEDMALRQAKEATRRSDSAWHQYRNANSKEESNNAVMAFGALGRLSWRQWCLLKLLLTSDRCNPTEDVLPLFPRDPL